MLRVHHTTFASTAPCAVGSAFSALGDQGVVAVHIGRHPLPIHEASVDARGIGLMLGVLGVFGCLAFPFFTVWLIMRTPPSFQFLFHERTTHIVALVSLASLLGVAAFFYFWHQRLDSAGKLLTESRRLLTELEGGQTAPTDRLDFTLGLPETHSSIVLARQLQGVLSSGGGQLSSLALSKLEPREQTLGSINVTGTLLGNYAGIKHSFAAAVSAEPDVVIRRLSIRRLTVPGDNLEATFDLLLLSRPAPPGGDGTAAQRRP